MNRQTLRASKASTFQRHRGSGGIGFGERFIFKSLV
jgi:hypothetical protein